MSALDHYIAQADLRAMATRKRCDTPNCDAMAAPGRDICRECDARLYEEWIAAEWLNDEPAA